MKIVRTPFLILLLMASISCQPKNKSDKQEVAQTEESDTQMAGKMSEEQLQKYETAYFASGCFWCVEAIFESVKGVKEVYSGYSGGAEKNPTYEEVSNGSFREFRDVRMLLWLIHPSIPCRLTCRSPSAILFLLLP